MYGPWTSNLHSYGVILALRFRFTLLTVAVGTLLPASPWQFWSWNVFSGLMRHQKKRDARWKISIFLQIILRWDRPECKQCRGERLRFCILCLVHWFGELNVGLFASGNTKYKHLFEDIAVVSPLSAFSCLLRHSWRHSQELYKEAHNRQFLHCTVSVTSSTTAHRPSSECHHSTGFPNSSETNDRLCNLGALCCLTILTAVLKGKCARGAFRDVVHTSPRHSLLSESHTFSQYTRKCNFTHDL